MGDMSENDDGVEVLHFSDGDGGPWRIGASQLKTLRGMIIDRDEAWRAHAEMAPVIDRAIRKGLKNIDEETFTQIHNFLWRGGLPGTYETCGFDEQKMRKAWRKYLPRHYRVKPKTKVAAELRSEASG
ncbi:hypothetical protein MMAR_4446 [Mycobacterium marinum M]|uniref:Uncharacterized protein n=1 Tax=Mycobacterium marinum (strain ATCC BAA-535 / M) TaxID=216594 RepID=B2HDG9_MYCMM|nr:hypothetical protein [Mycobacterium marinum]ACC42853.1 hypothetical protein MMAR_4446 [Mycobacterium marinum M]